MKLAALILCIASVSCAKPDQGPVYDYNDLPDGYSKDGLPTSSVGSKDYQDGFRAGFYEGLTYQQAIQ